MRVTFWGVRGSIATSGPEFARYGGNTTCVEVEAGGARIVLDAGTGLRPLGQKMLAEAKEGGRAVKATMLFTHLHWDHIQGFPFFSPAFHPATELELWGPGEAGLGLQASLENQMCAPNFPVPLTAMGSQRAFHTIGDGTQLRVGDAIITTRALVHPQGSLGYRIEADGAVFCFATDTEHLPGGEIDPALRQLADGADLLVYDAQYTTDEYEGRGGPSRRGWGHSTVEEAVRIGKACGARALGLFHHDPTHDDTMVQAMERDAQSRFGGAFACREGLTMSLS